MAIVISLAILSLRIDLNVEFTAIVIAETFPKHISASTEIDTSSVAAPNSVDHQSVAKTNVRAPTGRSTVQQQAAVVYDVALSA
jgi:hypothetical protein